MPRFPRVPPKDPLRCCAALQGRAGLELAADGISVRWEAGGGACRVRAGVCAGPALPVELHVRQYGQDAAGEREQTAENGRVLGPPAGVHLVVSSPQVRWYRGHLDGH